MCHSYHEWHHHHNRCGEGPSGLECSLQSLPVLRSDIAAGQRSHQGGLSGIRVPHHAAERLARASPACPLHCPSAPHLRTRRFRDSASWEGPLYLCIFCSVMSAMPGSRSWRLSSCRYDYRQSLLVVSMQHAAGAMAAKTRNRNDGCPVIGEHPCTAQTQRSKYSLCCGLVGAWQG